MITYKTAKKLKDAGFPQEYRKSIPWADFAYDSTGDLHLLHLDNDTDYWIGNDYTSIAKYVSEEVDKEIKEIWTKCPTLSELIEACGNNLIMITTPSLNTKKVGFIAWDVAPDIERKWWKGSSPNDNRIISNGSGSTGSTPEEAVANLWLKINNK